MTEIEKVKREYTCEKNLVETVVTKTIDGDWTDWFLSEEDKEKLIYDIEIEIWVLDIARSIRYFVSSEWIPINFRRIDLDVRLKPLGFLNLSGALLIAPESNDAVISMFPNEIYLSWSDILNLKLYYLRKENAPVITS